MKPSEQFRLTHQTSFPTIGEVFKGMLKASGLWDYLKSKESIQRKLNRFATEETILLPEEVQEIVMETLVELLDHEFYIETAESMILEFLDYYRRQVTYEATPYGRGRSLEWMATTRALIPCVLMVKRAEFFHLDDHMSYPRIHLPESKYWYLPKFDDGVWHLPTGRVFQWWLNLVGLKTPKLAVQGDGKRTYYPLSGIVSEDTMNNWMADGLNTIKPDIGTLKAIEQAMLGIEDEGMKKRSLIVVMLICNLVGSFIRKLCELIGDRKTATLIDDFKRLSDLFDSKEGRFFHELVDRSVQLHHANPEYADASADEKLQQDRTLMVGMAGDAVRNFQKVITQYLVLSAASNKLRAPEHGGFMTAVVEYEWGKSAQWGEMLHLDQETIEASIEGHSLLREVKPYAGSSVSESTRKAIGDLEFKLDIDPLRYLLAYISARIAYTDGDLGAAIDKYREAFNLGRYCAGREVLQIAEEYLTLLLALRGSVGNSMKPSKHALNYLIKWFRFMHPGHTYAKVEQSDATICAQQFYQGLFISTPVPVTFRPLKTQIQSLMMFSRVKLD